MGAWQAMAKIMAKVDLDSGASASEVDAVGRAFKDAGIDAEVRADVESRSSLPPWVMYVAIATVAGFFGAAGADAWKRLRDLITKLFRARDESKSPKGYVVVTITEVHERIVFSDGLPDEAFKSLLRMEIMETQAGQIQWDEETGTWRDPWDADRAT